MAKMLFNKVVKYEGTRYPQNTAVEVKDEDVDELKKAGGWVVGEPVKSKAEAEDNDEGGDATDEEDEKPVKETAAQKKAREKAEKAAAAAEAAKEGESGE